MYFLINSITSLLISELQSIIILEIKEDIDRIIFYNQPSVIIISIFFLPIQ